MNEGDRSPHETKALVASVGHATVVSDVQASGEEGGLKPLNPEAHRKQVPRETPVGSSDEDTVKRAMGGRGPSQTGPET